MRLRLLLSRDVECAVEDDDAAWLLSELRAGDPTGSALAGALEEAAARGEAVRPSIAETNGLIELFERSARPRTHALRRLEVALHNELYRRR
jgi:hypothetical protein